MSSPQPEHDPARIRRGKLGLLRGRLGALGVALALASVAAAAGAVVGARQGWLTYAGAHGVLFGLVAPVTALVAVVLGVLTLVFAAAVTPRRGFKRALFAILLGVATFFGVSRLTTEPEGAPPVHEAATDWRDPLMPSAALLQARGPGANAVEQAPALPEGPQNGVLGRLVAEVNAKTCPAAVPATVLGAPDAAYAKVRAALLAQKLVLVTDDPAGGRLEATAERGLFALKDDVIVRVRPEGAGTRIDFRSIARDGATDGGANCARLGKLREAVAG